MTEPKRPLTFDEARAVAVRTLDEAGPPEEAGRIVIMDERTQETEFGWIFRSQTRAYLETGDRSKQIPGVGPIVVLRDTGEAKFLPTFMSAERAIEQFSVEWRKKFRP